MEEVVAYLVAALCSLVWQNKNLNSFKPLENPYFDAIMSREYVVWSINRPLCRRPQLMSKVAASSSSTSRIGAMPKAR